MRDELSTIRITLTTKEKIQKLAKDKGFKDITALEYLLNKKISLDEIKN